MRRLKLLVIAGTRPEAIKLAPVIQELRRRGRHAVHLGVSAQHRELLDQVLQVFELKPDFDLDLMRPGQDLSEVSARVLLELRAPLRELSPDLVLVQGDTTTVVMSALAAFYQGIPVAHVEAGLRSGDLRRPFPEELNRKLTASIAALHFAPTEGARANLLREGVPAERIHQTGNTAIDSVLWMRERVRDLDLGPYGLGALPAAAPLVLVTAHRRESFGARLRAMLAAIRALATRFPAVHFVFPVHPNPNVRAPVAEVLGGQANVHCVDPLPYPPFVRLLDRALFALSDSGGVQEEGPALGTPVLVMRELTERPEAVAAGSSLVVGSDRARIEEVAGGLLGDPARLAPMARPRFPYGDGQAARRIADVLDAYADAEGLVQPEVPASPPGP